MCCLFGIIDYGHSLTAEQKTRMTSVLATVCEARGTDATGIAYNSHGKLTIYKRPLPGHRIHFRIPEDAQVIMGHTRMTTQGIAGKNYNNHPFLGSTKEGVFALAHNGVLYNDRYLRRSLGLPKTKIEKIFLDTNIEKSQSAPPITQSTIYITPGTAENDWVTVTGTTTELATLISTGPATTSSIANSFVFSYPKRY